MTTSVPCDQRVKENRRASLQSSNLSGRALRQRNVISIGRDGTPLWYTRQDPQRRHREASRGRPDHRENDDCGGSNTLTAQTTTRWLSQVRKLGLLVADPAVGRSSDGKTSKPSDCSLTCGRPCPKKADPKLQKKR